MKKSAHCVSSGSLGGRGISGVVIDEWALEDPGRLLVLLARDE